MKFMRYFATVLILLAGLALAACEADEVETVPLAGPGITVTPTTGLITTELGGTDIFNVVLDTEPTADVTIGLSSSNTFEGTVTAIPLTFTTLDWNFPQPVTVTGVNDLVPMADGPAIYTVITAPAVSTDLDYNGLDPADVTVTNADDDMPGFTVAPLALTTTEALGTATFNVLLNTQPTANVTIALSSSDISEGTVAPGGLTFTMALWNMAQTVTVFGVDDFLLDGNVPYTIITAPAASVDPVYNGLDPLDVAVTNTDNDVAGFVNPSFETGTTFGWTTLDIPGPFLPIQVAALGIPLPFFGNITIPTDGGFALVHGFDGAGPGFIQVLQDVGIPFGTTNLVFGWWAGWDLLTFGATLDRTLVVRIEPPGGGAMLQQDLILNANVGTIIPDTGPQIGVVNVSAFAGTVVRIVLEWSVPEPSSGPGNFQVDNFLLL